MPKLKQKFGPHVGEMGARIKAERERLGLSQEECARRLGISRGTWKNYEGPANPQLSTLIALQSLGFELSHIAPELAPIRPDAESPRDRSSARLLVMVPNGREWRPKDRADTALLEEVAGSGRYFMPLDVLLELARQHRIAVVFRGDLE